MVVRSCNYLLSSTINLKEKSITCERTNRPGGGCGGGGGGRGGGGGGSNSNEVTEQGCRFGTSSEKKVMVGAGC